MPGVPSYRRHCSGQARVTFHKKDEYLGPYGSQESIDRYWQHVRNWEARSRLPILPIGAALTVVELLERYFAYLAPRASGSVRQGATQAIRLLRDHCGMTRVEDLRPPTMRAIHATMIARGNCLNTVKDRMTRIRAILRWGVSEELVPPDVYARCKAVAPPTEHEGVRITKEREPVGDDVVGATLPHLPPTVADMVVLQRLTGMRSGELCSMTWEQIDRSAADADGMWHYRPVRHKTRRLGRTRVVGLGVESQAILGRYLDRAECEPIFSPRASEHGRLAAVRAGRRTPMTPSHVERASKARRRADGRPRAPSDAYAPDSLRRVIRRASERADVAPWHPHLLRHARGAELAGSGGLHVAQAALGHSDLRVTQRYAHILRQKNLLTEAAASETACRRRLRA